MLEKLFAGAKGRIAAGQAILLAAAAIAVVPFATVEAATVVTTTFNYSVSAQTFTVPAGVTSLTVTLKGGQGGIGGGDSQGSPTPGGYQGVVTGTISVTPGQVLTIGVGGAGGTGTSSQGSAPGGSAGLNPLVGYDGAVGGVAGPAGSSGGGGGSGAATVLRIGSADIVAGGAGGNGGNGQFLPIVGRRAEDNHVARPDATDTSGRPGLNTALACSAGFNCDGGASGAGGGGAQGGERGQVQYGGASATEYFGFGGYPGSNSSGGFSGLSTSYDFYSGNNANGSLTISYDDGAPGAPLNLAGTVKSGAVGLTWSAPATSGASAITDYKVEWATTVNGTYTTFNDGVSTTLATDVTGLTNGTNYFFRVSAIHTQGTGPTATTAVAIVPSDVPSRPTVTALTAFGAGIYVDFTPGATNSPVTGYEYRLDGGSWFTGSVSANRMTIAGLNNGQTYSVEIRALNIIGAGLPSTPAQTATPRDVPGAPTDLIATAGNQSVSMTWTVPSAINGAAITDYIVQRATAPGGPYTTFTDATSTSPSATITGLTNGTTYYVHVAAINAAGTSVYTADAVATPYTTPNAPSIALTPGDGTLGVVITPGSNGGSAVTGYEYRIGTSGSWQSTGSLATSFTISALTNGTSYDIYARAINAAGNSPASTVATGTPRTVPAAPSISAVALDTGGVSVSFSLGADGGSSITNVQYSIDGGTSWLTRSPSGTSSPLVITGLTGGQTYPVRLQAVNAAGNSAASNTSTVTAKGTPDAPTIVVTPVDSGLVVTFSTPANGGVPITNYQYSTDGGSNWITRSPGSTVSPINITGLDNGTSYNVRVRAVNSVGNGASSNTVSAMPRTVPGAPSIVGGTVVGVSGELDVVFTAPSSDGGSAIITYQYSTDGGTTWLTRASGTTGSPLTITAASSDGSTPLIGGQEYPVEIRAVNAAGAGTASAVAVGITTTSPEAPQIAGINAGDGTATIGFTPPANGGSAITRYEYRLDGGSWIDTGSLADSFVISGLTNGTTYGFELRAVNGVGDGDPSASLDIEVFTTPSAPSLGTIVPGDGTLSIPFTAGDDGGSAVTTYQYSTDGGVTWRTRTSGTTGSPLVITVESGVGAPALTNAHLYAVQVRGVNAAGAGAASETRLVAPRGVPSAPSNFVVTEANGALVVSFTGAADNGSSITAYEYQLDGGGWADAGSLSSPFTINTLTNGTTYTVAVRARNAIGAGAGSTTLTGTPRTTPNAPTGVQATNASHQISVSWTAPVSDGGAPISGYTVNLYTQASGGSPVGTCSTSGALTCTVTGLTNGTTLFASVVATNAAGSGAASSPRVAQTPLAAPQVSIASITAGANSLSVAVTVVDNGGAAITAYEYQLDNGSWVAAPTASSPFIISGLTTGTQYSVKIRAANGAGTGAASSAVSATPHTTPGTPTALSASSAAASAVLSWSAPSNNGGMPVTDYVVQWATTSGGTYTTFADGTSSATTATVTGLTNGTMYYFRVAAVNTAGQGSYSSLASTTPLAAPGAPTISGITAGSGFLSVAFTAPASNGGTAITAYQYQLDGGTWRAATGTTSPITITGLDNGTTYAVQLRAVNAVGNGTASNSVNGKPVGIPGAVNGFHATPTSNSVVLDWDPADDNGSPITSYNVIRWSSLTEGAISASLQPTTTSATFSLGAGTYYFTVEATNANGTGARTSPRTTATVGATMPSAPTAVSAANVDGAVAMSWTAGAAGTSAIASYLVQYSTDGTNWITASSNSSATSASFTLPSASTSYRLRVAAISASGTGAFTTIRPPVAVSGTLSSVTATTASISGTVNANTGTPTVSFEYATSAVALGTGSATVVAATPSSASGSSDTAVTAALTGLAPNTLYYVRTIATATDGTTRGATRMFTTNASIISSGLSPVYTGSPVTFTTVTSPLGLLLTRTFVGISGTVYPSSSTPPTDVGTYSVTTTPTDILFGGSEIATLTIQPKPVAISVSATDRDYDGTIDVDLTLGLPGAVIGDDVHVNTAQISGAVADADAGVAKTVTITSGAPLLTGSDAANYAASIAGTTTVTIDRADQTLVFTSTAPSPATVGSSYTATVSSNGTGAVVFTIDAGSTSVCVLSGNEVTFIGAGSCIVNASSAADANYAAGTQQQTITVADPAQPQTITLPEFDDLALDEGPVDLPSESDSGLPVTYTAGPSDVCTVSGTTLTLVGAGTCEVTADQAGDSLHLPATASGSFEVTRLVQTVTLPDLDDLAIDEGPVTLPSETAGHLPLTYTAGPSDVCTVSGATLTLVGAGTCEVTADQAGDDTHLPATDSGSFEVSRNVQTVSLPDLDDLELDEGPIALPAETTGHLPLTYTAGPSDVCTVSGTTLTLVGAGTCTVTANQAGDDTHLPATDIGSFEISKITQTLTIPGLGDVSIDASPVTLPSTAGGLPLTYTVGPPNVCVVSGTQLTLLAEGTCTVTAHQAGDATHAPASVTRSFVVGPTMLSLVLQLDAGEVVRGATVLVTAENLMPNSEVRIELHSEIIVLGTGMTDANGSLSITVTLPNNITVGSHDIVAIGVGPNGGAISASTEMYVDWSGSLAETISTGGYTPGTATRILDTRELGARMPAATEYRLAVPGGLVPGDVTALVLNLTVTEGVSPGFVTVYPCGAARPLAAAINFAAGETKANLVETRFVPGDELCLWSNVATHVVVDFQGFHHASGTSRLVPRTAVRLIDTRPANGLVAGQTLVLPVIGAGIAPAGTSTVTLNVAVDEPQAPGFLTVYPCGADRPWASNVNFVDGQTVSNEVMVEPGDGGAVCVYTSAATQLIVDLNATYQASGDESFTALVPGRLGDTRLATKVLARQTLAWTVVGPDDIGDVTAMSLNIAATEPEGPGFLTVYPCGQSMPLASNLNFGTGQTISNHVTATVGDDGTICVFASTTTHIVIDIEGIYRSA